MAISKVEKNISKDRDKSLSGISIEYTSRVIKGENVIVLTSANWDKLTTRISSLKRKEAKLKKLETVGIRIKSAIAEVKEIKSGMKHGQTIDSLIKELKYK